VSVLFEATNERLGVWVCRGLPRGHTKRHSFRGSGFRELDSIFLVPVLPGDERRKQNDLDRTGRKVSVSGGFEQFTG